MGERSDRNKVVDNVNAEKNRYQPDYFDQLRVWDEHCAAWGGSDHWMSRRIQL